MGTNFYLMSRNQELMHEYFAVKKSYGITEMEYELVEFPYLGYEVHLNKLSAGWRPLFQSHRKVKTFRELEKFCLDHENMIEIYDEYGEKYTWQQYFERVYDHSQREPEAVKWVYEIDPLFGEKSGPRLYTRKCTEEEAELCIPFNHRIYVESEKTARKRFGLQLERWGNMEYVEDPYYPFDRENGDYSYEVPKVIQLFAQHDTRIDKFKPSRSQLCVSYDVEDIVRFLTDGTPKYLFCQLEDMLKMMSRHPFMCYEAFCGERVGFYTGSFVVQYLKREIQDKHRILKTKLSELLWHPYTVIKICLAGKDKCIETISLYDFEKNNPGWRTDYKYEVQYVFTEEATEAEEQEWLRRWWHRETYGFYGSWGNIVKVAYCRKAGRAREYIYEDNNKG